MSRLILCTLLMVTPMILTSYTRASSTFKVSKGERIKVDVGKNSEMYVMREAGKKVTVMYDFNKRLMLLKLPGPRSLCILKASTGGASQPAALKKALNSVKKNSNVKLLPKTKEVLIAGGNVNFKEQSYLSKEMADLCKNLPIMWANGGRKNDTEQIQDTGDNRRVKRSCKCVTKSVQWNEYKRSCRTRWFRRVCTTHVIPRYKTVIYQRC